MYNAAVGMNGDFYSSFFGFFLYSEFGKVSGINFGNPQTKNKLGVKLVQLMVCLVVLLGPSSRNFSKIEIHQFMSYLQLFGWG